MKTFFFITISLFYFSSLFAQEPADALRYSWITQSGTARNQSIGGASGSLGGEFSTLFTNPAGLGFYKTDEFVLTPGISLQKNKSTYRSTVGSMDKNNFIYGASGLLFSFPSYRGGPLKNFTLALGINQAASFANDVYYKGTNNNSSYSEKYLEELANNNVTDPNHAANDYPFGSSLALNTYLIDTVNNSQGRFTGYKTLAPIATGLTQEKTIHTKGGITDLALGGALNFRDKLFFGATITVPILNYQRNSLFKESDATANVTNRFNYFTVDETLKTTGVGLNAKLGLIYKPVEYVRLGLALHSPTYYQVTDKYSTTINTDLEGFGGAGIKTQSSDQFTGNVPAESKYNLVTPWRVIASGSYVFREVENVKRQRAFITADVEYVDYSASKFTAADGAADTKNYFANIKSVINQQYKGAFNVRLGGELKFNTIMVRLGGAYYGNPYRGEKADKIRIGGGLGYRDKGIFIDLGYVYSVNRDVEYAYRLDAKNNDAAMLKNKAGNVVLTVGWKLW